MKNTPSVEDVVVVADLHMSSGWDPVAAAPSRSEDFFNDGPFARFLDWRLEEGRLRRRAWRLLLLGDFLDFTRVELGVPDGDRRRLDMSAGAALAKLERIVAGHPEVFEALRRLTASGVAIDIVPGNHDLELLHAPVQSRVREVLHANLPATGGAVSVHPWIFHLPGVLYAEHGHQHHDINRIPGMAGAQDAEGLGPPLGSRVVEWMTAVIDAADPGGPLEPSFRRLAGALRGRPAALATAWRAHWALLTALAHFALGRRAGGATANRTGFAPDALAAQAAALGLPTRTVAELDALGATSSAKTALRLLGVVLGGLRRSADGPSASVEAGSGYMRAAASAAHRVLTAAGQPAACYVFAHTHLGELAPLAGGRPATYLNTGTWSSLVRDPSSPPTFVEVDCADGDGRLRAWDDPTGRAEDLASSSPSVRSARGPADASAPHPLERQRT